MIRNIIGLYQEGEKYNNIYYIPETKEIGFINSVLDYVIIGQIDDYELPYPPAIPKSRYIKLLDMFKADGIFVGKEHIYTVSCKMIKRYAISHISKFLNNNDELNPVSAYVFDMIECDKYKHRDKFA